MFWKPHDVPPMFCFNVQTDMGFLLYELLSLEVGIVKSLMSGAVVIWGLRVDIFPTFKPLY